MELNSKTLCLRVGGCKRDAEQVIEISKLLWEI